MAVYENSFKACRTKKAKESNVNFINQKGKSQEHVKLVMMGKGEKGEAFLVMTHHPTMDQRVTCENEMILSPGIA